MVVTKMMLAVAALSLMAVVVAPLSAQNSTSPSNPSSDNTKVNKRDRNASEPTADQGKNNNSDRETMRKIRRAVMNDKALSTYGHNIKIISQQGKVTLKGTVHTEDEKKSIEAKATEIAGAENVTNQITVKGDSK